MKRPSRQQRREAAEARLEADVHEAMMRLGWQVPTDDRAVRAAEEALAAEPVDLPASLGDARAVWEGRRAAEVRPRLEADEDGTVDVPLARAAREGGPIPPQIEQRMRADRLRAQRERDDESSGTAETS
ncbi:MAG: hypothetical protein GX591_09740 [Planctomycetes bacterium]|nr:hypothetical protein [Planctomycetota bacterium]